MHNFLLNGGGLDSYAYSTIMTLFGIEHWNIHINYSHIASNTELEAVKYLSTINNTPMLEIKSTSGYIRKSGKLFNRKQEDPFILGRNLSLSLDVVKYCIENNIDGKINIVFGFVDPGYQPMGDASEKFLRNLNEVISNSFNTDTTQFVCVAPFIQVPRDILISFAYLIDNSIFENSKTCWVPKKGEPCGTCKHCILQQELIKKVSNLNISDKMNLLTKLLHYASVYSINEIFGISEK
jgi:7-cyano-7-deazaguanine synthase in queuosine biosynthesis